MLLHLLIRCKYPLVRMQYKTHGHPWWLNNLPQLNFQDYLVKAHLLFEAYLDNGLIQH